MTTTASDTSLNTYTLPQLYAEAQGLAAVLADFKARGQAIQAEIERRVAPFVEGAIASSGKTHGVVNAPIDNRMSIKIDMPKKVAWDSAKLQAVAQTMPWERVKAIFKIDFSVSETTYKGIGAVDPSLAASIDRARTVTYGAPKVTLVMADEAAS